MIKTRLHDGGGTGNELAVTNDHAALVSVVPADPISVPFEVLYKEKLISGSMLDSTASKDVAVNGSVTEVPFQVLPGASTNVFVSWVRFIMQDASMKLDSNEVRGFASAAGAPGLTNGLKLELIQAGVTYDLFSEPVQNLLGYYRYADNDGIVGITDGISAGVDYFSMTMSFPIPISMERGTADSLSLIVRDDLTAVDLFEVDYSGYRIEVE